MKQSRENLEAFLDSLTSEMLSFCGPIFIAPGLKTYPGQMIDNGTYSLIDTGQRRILVTCHHVWQAYLESRAANTDTILAVNLGDGDASIAFAAPEQHLIAADPELDLVTFSFEPSQIQVNKSPVSHQKDWFPIRQWPIPKTASGEHVALMGFPAKMVKKNGIHCTFTTQLIPLKVSGSGEREIYIFNENENIEVFSDIRSWLGGLSGSPAYSLSDNGASLVGFVKSGFKRMGEEEQPKPDSIFAGSLSLTHAAFLQPDGTLACP